MHYPKPQAQLVYDVFVICQETYALAVQERPQSKIDLHRGLWGIYRLKNSQAWFSISCAEANEIKKVVTQGCCITSHHPVSHIPCKDQPLTVEDHMTFSSAKDEWIWSTSSYVPSFKKHPDNKNKRQRNLHMQNATSSSQTPADFFWCLSTNEQQQQQQQQQLEEQLTSRAWGGSQSWYVWVPSNKWSSSQA